MSVSIVANASAELANARATAGSKPDAIGGPPVVGGALGRSAVAASTQ